METKVDAVSVYAFLWLLAVFLLWSITMVVGNTLEFGMIALFILILTNGTLGMFFKFDMNVFWWLLMIVSLILFVFFVIMMVRCGGGATVILVILAWMIMGFALMWHTTCSDGVTKDRMITYGFWGIFAIIIMANALMIALICILAAHEGSFEGADGTSTQEENPDDLATRKRSLFGWAFWGGYVFLFFLVLPNLNWSLVTSHTEDLVKYLYIIGGVFLGSVLVLAIVEFVAWVQDWTFTTKRRDFLATNLVSHFATDGCATGAILGHERHWHRTLDGRHSPPLDDIPID
jgi:hypothetical protein